jgi:chloramphenicol O-acetyltransferase
MRTFNDMSDEELRMNEGFSAWDCEHPGYTINLLDKQLANFDMFIETYERQYTVFFRVVRGLENKRQDTKGEVWL